MNGVIAAATVRAYDGTGRLAGTAVSDVEGRFALELTKPGPYRLVSSGGRLNGTEYRGELGAWCGEGLECGVTPLSTALVNLMQEGGFNAGDGKAFLYGALGLEEDPFLGDAGGVEGFDLAAARTALANGTGLQSWVSSVVAWTLNTNPSAPPGIPPEEPGAETNPPPAPDPDLIPEPDPIPEPEPGPEPAPMPIGPPGSCPQGSERSELLRLVNNARSVARQCGSTAHGPAAPLQWSCQLESAALGHSIDMGLHNFFSHTGSDGLSPGHRITQAGYTWRGWAENIAAGHPTAEAVVLAWLNSPGHCRNIMNPNMVHMGVAYTRPTGSNFRIYWTQKFARP